MKYVIFNWNKNEIYHDSTQKIKKHEIYHQKRNHEIYLYNDKKTKRKMIYILTLLSKIKIVYFSINSAKISIIYRYGLLGKPIH